MATSNPAAAAKPRRGRRLLVYALLAALLLFAWYWAPLNAFARTGAAVGARVACSCRFVGGRDLADCRKDFEPGMELVILREDARARSVTAHFPLLASETATYREGAGCQLELWTD